MRVEVAQRVGPQDVGRRVVLRRRLPDGGLGDLLGDLVRWDSEQSPAASVTVRTRAGDVTVAVDDVLGGKPVPPAPARRGRPHRTIDWRDLEDVASDGWRAPDSQRLTPEGAGWLLRAADGFTGRANSALAVGDPGLPLADAVDRVEAWDLARGLPPRFAVAWPLSVRRLAGEPGPAGIDTDLDRELAGRGYRLEMPKVVLTAASREVAVAMTPVGGGDATAAHEVRLDPQPDDVWLAGYHYRGKALPTVARRLLLSAPQQVFASVRDAQGHALAVARGASSRGWTGITAMEVDPQHRRQGLAHRLLARLAGWAVDVGDACMYLQVAEDSTGARSLYDSVGFAPHHGYHYRVGG
jgi:GNAT superfamily N-acetyltransferase